MIKNLEKTTMNLYDLMDKIDEGLSVDNFLLEVDKLSKLDLVAIFIRDNEPDLIPFIELVLHYIEVQKNV